jgi:hypothetical protein
VIMKGGSCPFRLMATPLAGDKHCARNVLDSGAAYCQSSEEGKPFQFFFGK